MQLALFYEALAAVFERARRFQEAEATFEEGIRAEARPTERLTANFEAFRRRMHSRKRKASWSSGSPASTLAPFASSDLPLRSKRVSDSPCGSVTKTARRSARSSVSSATEANVWHLLCQDATVSSVSSKIPSAMFDDPTYTLDQMNREVLAIITGEDTETVSTPTGARERSCDSSQVASAPRRGKTDTLQEMPSSLGARRPLGQTHTARYDSCLEALATEGTVDFERVNRLFDEQHRAPADAGPSAAAATGAGGLEIYEDSDMAIPRPSECPDP